MGNVVNFNKAKKAKGREASKAQAVENRVRFGRGKAEKALAKAEADKASRTLDGARREGDDS